MALKLVHASFELCKKHYADLSSKPFYEPLCKFMSSGPVVAIVFEGKDVRPSPLHRSRLAHKTSGRQAVKTGRAMLGATNPLASNPGTIRGDYAIDVGRNICHGSDSVESAKKEIGTPVPSTHPDPDAG